MKNRISDISSNTISRYSMRYSKYGRNIKTLGWGSAQQQEYRFSRALSGGVEFNDRIVLDIGCGFGDLFEYLKGNNVSVKQYIGWDINSELVNEARSIYSSEKRAIFEVRNIFDTQSDGNIIADIGIMLGVLNFNLNDICDNYEYSETAIKHAYALVNDVLIVDFLSSYRTDTYPQENFVFYHCPERMLEYALKLSHDVELYHSYASIPQKEFMLFIYK